MRACAALLLSLNFALSGCAGCYLDAVSQPLPSQPSMALDCDPLLAAR